MSDASYGRDSFSRSRHLFIALVASAAFVTLDLWLDSGSLLELLRRLGGDGDRTIASSTLAMSLRLLLVAFSAWLALAVWDTHSGVTPRPCTWRSIGIGGPAIIAAELLYLLGVASRMSTSKLHEWSTDVYGMYATANGFDWGWFLLRTAAGVTAEELLFRVLIQRALEGYMAKERALVAQAVLFQAAHTWLYGYGASLYPGIGGVAYGLVFMRTRSLAAPVVLHMLHNIGHFVIVTSGVTV